MSEHDPEDSAGTPRRSLFEGEAAAAGAPGTGSGSAPDAAVPPQAVTVRRGGTPLLLTLVLAAGLGGAGYYGWTHPMPGGQAQAGNDDHGGFGQQVQALSARVDALEHQGAAGASQTNDATAELARKVDGLSGKVTELQGRQDQLAAQASKMAEAASQLQAVPAAAPPPPDTTAQQVPGLIAGQQASDSGKALDDRLNQGLSAQKTAMDQSVADQKAALEKIAADQKTQLDQSTADLKTAADKTAADQKATLDKTVADQKATLDKTAADQKAALDVLDQRLGKLEQAQVPDQAGKDIAARQAAALAAVDLLGGRIAKLEQGQGAVQAQDDTSQKARAGESAAIQALDARVAKLEGEDQGAGAAKDASWAIRIEAAEAALMAGQPLGELAGAPPALTRFATAAPPTEGALRAQFPAVADAARAASQPEVAHRSFLDRALARVQQSVVVRRGDHVLVGDPAAGVLAQAQAHVSAGDLKGAVDSLGALQGQAAQAVSGWVGQVHALLDARAALASLAAHG